MKHSWTVACKRGIIEQGTDRISLMEVIEKITIRKTKGLPPGMAAKEGDPTPEEVLEEVDVILFPMRMQVVSYWTRSDRGTPETGRARMQILGPKGQVVGAIEADVDLSEHINRRTMSNLDIFPFVGYGVYRVATHRKSPKAKRWTLCAESHIEVVEGAAE